MIEAYNLERQTDSMTKRKTNPRVSKQARARGHTIETDSMAFRLYYAGGQSLAQVKKAMKYTSRPTAQRAIDRAFKRIIENPDEESREIALKKVREVQLAHLSLMKKADIPSSSVYLRALEMENKLLGLDIAHVDVTSQGQRVMPRVTKVIIRACPDDDDQDVEH